MLGRRKQEREEFAQINARVTRLNAELKEATLSGLPPDQREERWQEMQAIQHGMSVPAWRAHEERRIKSAQKRR